jgi:hypothetical protein
MSDMAMFRQQSLGRFWLRPLIAGWYALYPIHYCIFKGMLHQIAAIAQRESAVASAPA